MSFSTEQVPHQQLRSIIAEKTSRVVFWIGSGLSVSANLPTWPQLKDLLINRLRDKASSLGTHGARHLSAVADKADNESNNWIAFQILKENLGTTSFRAAIREALQPAPTAQCPEAYKYIWRIGPAGILNLNLDRLATRALGEVKPGHMATEFAGKNVAQFTHSLKSPRPFIANLHGTADDASSWILTKNDLTFLLNSKDYQTFIHSCLTTTITVFIGISANDIAVKHHLRTFTQRKIDIGSHYWITNKNDLSTDRWAERAGIQIIRYEEHEDISELFEDILNFIPEDEPSPPPVILTEKHTSESSSPAQLLQLDADDLRRVLNAKAQGILESDSAESYRRYDEFSATYDQAIYRAWYTSTTPPDNKLLGFTLISEVGRGAFGRVYQARSLNGDQVAIKVLLEDVRRDPKLLKSFRRGVRSMRFLAAQNVEGMVAYHEASEIPAFVVMDWVEGPTLSDAQATLQIDDWGSILKIGREMTDVICRAHAIPERVLHRDIRPPNIMLSGFYSSPDSWHVVVLDFDLSWHQGAFEQSVIHGASRGYLAPEQIQVVQGASTRHATVDSFGVGMTLYFMIAGTDPLPAQHRHTDWNRLVLDAALGRTTIWESLPFRYTRLILNSTHDRQSSRWDMSQIRDELKRLSDAFLFPTKVVSAELLAEEIAARTRRKYTWIDDQMSAVFQLTSGLEIKISGNESARMVLASLNWSSRGRHVRKRIDKWMPRAREECVRVLKSVGWKIRIDNAQPRQSVVIVAELKVEQATLEIASHSEAITKVIQLLDFE